jgi:hypothetical protein
MLDPRDLIVAPGNSKEHSGDQIAEICGLILEFGFTRPILIDPTQVIIAGHGAREAAIKLDMERVPCVVVDGLSPAQVKALRIADNKIAEKSSWDLRALKDEFTDIMSVDNALLGLTGFDFEEIDDILGGELEALADDGDDEIPTIHFLTVGSHKIEITPEQMKKLSDHLSKWSKKVGSYQGCVDDLIQRILN